MACIGAGFLLFTLVTGCSTPPKRVDTNDVEKTPVRHIDPHSYAQPSEVAVWHMGLRWMVSFEREQLNGSATLLLDRRMPLAPLRLDTRGLTIREVRVGSGPPASEGVPRVAELGTSATWVPAQWELGPMDPILGQPLVVTLPEGLDAVRIDYETSPEATGLQWLAPEQTAGGRHPFLYSQSQAIHARSWIPCQDTPSVRTSFDAVVRSDVPLQALMAADAHGRDASGAHGFSMTQPVPSYLLALAVGELEFASLGPRTGVWAEPAILDRAAHEFADVESMIGTSEALYGSYRWGRYDLLVLPPAFPFGGMENPKLTFVTPTILAGDRSLVSLIAHELAHSWSGNLVTNASWGDLWLNEGFTVYIERRLIEALYGETRAKMEAALGFGDLEQVLSELAPEAQRLRADLSGGDPDRGLNDVPYEKGALFLRLLEQTYGRDVFDRFLSQWFADHAFTSVTTEEFVEFLDERLLHGAQPLPGQSLPDVLAWIDGPGIGPGAPPIDTTAFDEVDRAAVQLAAGELKANGLKTADWTPHHWLRFLRRLPPDVSATTLTELDAAWSLTQSGNSEVVAQWLEVGIRRGYAGVEERLVVFLKTVGRRKYLVPLYRALVDVGRLDDARRIYASAAAGYHAIARTTLAEIVSP